MKKTLKFVLVFAVIAMLACALGVNTFAAGADTVETFAQLYIGEYEQEGSELFTGMAHVIFGTVSNTATEYGVIVEKEGRFYKFPGKKIGESGKFGVAIYQLPEGDYVAYAYTGEDDNRTMGEPTYFTANKATYTVTFDMSKVGGISTSETVAQGTATEFTPDTTGLTSTDAVVGLYYADNTKYDPNAIVKADTTITAKWTDDGHLDGKTIKYKSVSGQSYYTSIGSAIAADLTDGSSMVMTFDILSGHTYANFETKTAVLGYIPPLDGGAKYNNGWSSTTYIALAGNPAYTATATQHYGYMSCTGGYTFPNVQFGTNPADPDLVMTTGKTFKAVYTAPTAEAAGSIIWYTKDIGAADNTYVESASMRNIPESTIIDPASAYFWLNFYNCSAGGGASMSFTNFKVSVGEWELPLMFFNHYDTEITVEAPKHTVSYDVSQVSKTAVSSTTVEEGSTITAPTVTPVATPRNAVLAWFDEDGNEFDFSTAIENDMTLTARWIADKTMYDKVYDIKAVGDTAMFGSSIATDLTGGKSLTMEWDILESKISAANYNMSYWVKYYGPTADVTTSTVKEFSAVSGQHTSQMYANYAYYSPWPTKYTANGLKTSGLTHGEGSNPISYYAAGNTFRWVYKAPVTKADGTGATGYMKMYTKPIGADDSQWTLVGSLEGLVSTGTTSTSHVHPSSVTHAIIFADLRKMASNKMVVTHVRIFGDDGVDIPWTWDSTNTNFVEKHEVNFESNGQTISSSVVESGATITAPASVAGPTGATLAYWADENGDEFDFSTTITKNTTLTAVWTYPTYKIGVDKDTTGAKTGWLMTSTGTTTGTGEKLTMEMDVISSNFSDYNINVGISIFNYLGVSNNYGSGFHDSQYIANGVNSSSSWKTEDVSNKTAPTMTALNIGAIWAAGNSVKVVYTMPTSTATGSIVVYTKATTADASAYVEVASCTGIAQDMVVNSGGKVMIGMIFQATQTYTAFPHMVVTNLRTYSETAELQFVAQHLLAFEEVEA